MAESWVFKVDVDGVFKVNLAVALARFRASSGIEQEEVCQAGQLDGFDDGGKWGHGWF